MRSVAEIFTGKALSRSPDARTPCGCGGRCGECSDKPGAASLADSIWRGPALIRGGAPRGVLSLWTRTPMFRLGRGPTLIQTLAVCLAARNFPETQFVTDTGGALIAQQLGWEFSSVSLALEDFNPQGLEHVWALGKFVALTIQQGPCIQFDGDVLIFNPLPDTLCRARLIAQSPDFPSYYDSADMRRALALSKLPAAVPYNAGLLGGSDAALVRAYAFSSLELAAKFTGCDLNGTTTSMCVEQYHLGVFAQRVGVEVATLLPARPSEAQLEAAGYAHLVGGAKRAETWLARAEARLSRDFPEAYERFLAGWPAIAASAGAEIAAGSVDDTPYAVPF
jgi:hypothetical protein